VSARQHAAFNAYRALYEAGLLNDYLLPLTSVLEPDQEEEVKTLLQDVMKRTGMADVDLQMDPWLPAAGDKQQWFTSHLEIGDLPVLQIFTQVPLPDGTIFPLYPRYRDPITVRVSSASEGRTDASTLAAAREWTRMMFWSSHATRMDWDNLDFKYVLFPAKPLGDALVWGKRRDWWKRLEEERGGFKQEKALMAPADLFGEAFGWPSNVDFVVERKEMPTHRFLGWRHDAVSDEIAQHLEEKAVNGKVAVTYPLIHSAALPRRANFLVPTLEPATLYEGYILPALTRVLLSPRSEIEFALLLPSVVRHMSMTMTLYSFKETVLKKTPLAGIRPNLLHVALTAPVSQEKDNYQRLETLGDCALKMIASVSLFAAHPYWHEGYLSRRKDHMVSNAQLAVHAVRVELFRWIIRDRFVARKWKPAMNNDKVKQEAPVAPPSTTDDEDANKKNKKEKMQLSTKMLADVVESCIGASMETGGWDLALECVKLFGLGASGWKTIPESVQMILERTEDLPDFPSQTSDVEKMMGYTFKRKAYLVEAITHSSSQSHFRTTSYERMEFLGDAVSMHYS
jgi:endoribonuclease Dicer